MCRNESDIGTTTSSQHHAAKKTILVVGDWIVDEHWVIAAERSPTASRRGDAHYHAVHTLENTVVAPCGAGLVASHLARAKASDSDQTPFLRVHGIGLWHSDDEPALKAMMEPDNTRGDTPFRIMRSARAGELASSTKLELHNVQNCISDEKVQRLVATTRVIRHYNKIGDKVRLAHRVDWEVYIPDDQRASNANEVQGWVTEESMLNNLSSLNSPSSETQIDFSMLDAIVIKDLVKGVVSNVMIRWLVSQLPDKNKVEWYISSKAWCPSWLEELKNCNVRLLLLPQVCTDQARKSRLINAWCVAGARPSSTALRLIDDLNTRLKSKADRLIVALPKDMVVIAKSRQTEPGRLDRLIIQPREQMHHQTLGMPMASVLFSSLVVKLLGSSNVDHAEALRSSLHYTDEWMVRESGRIQRPEEWKPNEPALYHIVNSSTNATSGLQEYDWSRLRTAWEQSRSGLGIIDGEQVEISGRKGSTLAAEKLLGSPEKRLDIPGKRIELWRAMTDIDGYVCCVKKKRDVLRNILRQLDEFTSSTTRRHRSMMIHANPGAGKTFLVSRVAKQKGYRLLVFNITQMTAKEDLLDCFDMIVSTQSQLADGRPLLVFFDEINAQLQRSPVYDTFLSPLADGTYTKEGRTFTIQPCVWLFAGTGFDKSRAVEKGSDFEDRLSVDPFDYCIDGNSTSDAEIRLEMSYIAASLIQDEFPDVHVVTDKVLDLFSRLSPKLSVRKLKKLVGSLKDVRHKVQWSNVDDLTMFDAHYHKEKESRIELEREVHIWTSPHEDVYKVAKSPSSRHGHLNDDERFILNPEAKPSTLGVGKHDVSP